MEVDWTCQNLCLHVCVSHKDVWLRRCRKLLMCFICVSPVLRESGCTSETKRHESACSPPDVVVHHTMDNSKPHLCCFDRPHGYTCLWYPTFPPPQDDVRRLDDEVWALFSNFSNGRAASPPLFSSKSSSSSSYSSSSRVPTSSSSSRWSLRNLSPPSPPSGISSSVRPTRPQPYSPGHAPRLQVHSVKDHKRFTGLFVSW